MICAEGMAMVVSWLQEGLALAGLCCSLHLLYSTPVIFYTCCLRSGPYHFVHLKHYDSIHLRPRFILHLAFLHSFKPKPHGVHFGPFVKCT